MSEIRIAKISKIDTATKKAAVLYPDRAHTVSKLLPGICDVTRLNVGDTVVVGTIDNATDGSAIILGKIK